ncbi:hypothetical protein P6144_00160 [Sphingomonas sp. HITSZ_GF]|uniref:hypothetical protein n=1 Tax=Sphingomonas sp. HITSZ_GF TaxID=3037247 RepID=UPI00240D5DB4|nr:hypothetical protein [Sphingomonas sp. HITSZ_GF]MDG2532048.1 hypothetical protein [Sphingomonas sp. HITSZ_GF]
MKMNYITKNDFTDDELNVLARVAWIGKDFMTDFEYIAELAGLTLQQTIDACRKLDDADLVIAYERIDDSTTGEDTLTINEDSLHQTRNVLRKAGMWPPRKTNIRRATSTAKATGVPSSTTKFVTQLSYTRDEALKAHRAIDAECTAGRLKSRSAGALKAHITRRIEVAQS